jgi:hypothetical protein
MDIFENILPIDLEVWNTELSKPDKCLLVKELEEAREEKRCRLERKAALARNSRAAKKTHATKLEEENCMLRLELAQFQFRARKDAVGIGKSKPKLDSRYDLAMELVKPRSLHYRFFVWLFSHPDTFYISSPPGSLWHHLSEVVSSSTLQSIQNSLHTLALQEHMNLSVTRFESLPSVVRNSDIFEHQVITAALTEHCTSLELARLVQWIHNYGEVVIRIKSSEA